MDIFDLKVDDLEKESKGSKNYENEFKPNPDEAKDKVYRALIRPVYWLDNPKKNYIPKTTFYFDKNDGNDTGNNFFDSPYSINETCLAMNTFFDLKREGKTDARAEELAKQIRPKSSFFYLVLVESDAVNPENEGKIMVYKAPIQVHKIIQGAISVSEEDQKIGIKPCNIFDPFKGKSLRMSINKVGGNWNYNGSVVLTESGPLKLNGKEVTTDDKDGFMEMLKEANELMKTYEYKPLTEDRQNLLLSIISAKTGKRFGKITPAKAELEIEGLDDDSDDTLNVDLEEKDDTVVEEKPKAPKAKKEAKIADDEFDDILDDLGF